MPDLTSDIETVRASRAGHTFHERWAARRALQLVFPNDSLVAIAVEGISSTETASIGASAEEVADLVLYYGCGESFRSCDRLETVQFKYKVREEVVTGAYLKKTIEKFSDTILGYEKEFPAAEVDKKVSFSFVTNAEFNDNLWDAIKSLMNGSTPSESGAATQARNLRRWCANRGLSDASRLFSKIIFRAGERSLAGQDNALKRTLTDWSAGSDSEARLRLYGLQDLVLKKAGPTGQGKNLIRREDVLDALDCEPEDLFPAETRFIDVGIVVERAELSTTSDLLKSSDLPVFVHAEGGVGKTVFIQSLAKRMASEFEIIIFDCFGGGAYRSENHARHLPKIGLVQIVNELAARTLCDPMLPGSDDTRKTIKTALKRLAQAAKAVRTQSIKIGLLIIVDAADNAQLEAEYRHEEPFPRRLLTALDENPIDGVRLLFTARTHRKDKVIDHAKVVEVELGPFTDSEAREFLKDRRPGASSVEIATALSRSGRNARVLDYLIQTWDANVRGDISLAPITVPEIIAQRCTKIFSGLHVAGWQNSEVVEFFVALSLLPPPIPLEELANALGWSSAQVNTAASDLAPMLEVTSHGAIFRDEPTETYVRETYSERPEAQRAIADRLLSSQATSTYAAEALPHFLVVIKDSDRAFVLAESDSFPATVQSEFGRHRLTLARLRAAFRLAVAEDDLDRVLGLSMRLGLVTTANMRGDEFIRSSPALAMVLGDADAYRRLFADRTGWRGARSARLIVAHLFAGDSEEAQIQCESTIRWIGWHSEQLPDQVHHDVVGPEVTDFAAVLFQRVSEGDFIAVDRNLASWNDGFSFLATNELLQLMELFDQAKDTTILADFVSFAASDECTSQALKVHILSKPRYLNRLKVRRLAKAIGGFVSAEAEGTVSRDRERGNSGDIALAALTALFYSSRSSAAMIISHAPMVRPTSYDYSERYGHSRVWSPIIGACIRAWSAGRPVAYHDLLPQEVKVTRQVKAVTTQIELRTFLKEYRVNASGGVSGSGGKKQLKTRFSDYECDDISKGVQLARDLIRPIEDAVLSRTPPSEATVSDFLDVWREHMRTDVHWRGGTAADLLARTVGLGCINILLDHASKISNEQAITLISLVSSGQFSVPDKTNILARLALRPNLHELAGGYAQQIAEQIHKDDNIGQRGSSYIELSASLVPMSFDEAREYYRQGLAQLDQLGGESYDQIYSLLHFASVQQGGFLKPELAQRLMNLCQTIVQNEPRKFGWTLFARAAANSIGFPAISKLLRWHDQDVADRSYGLPQLACFLAKNGKLDPLRAAFVLSIFEDHGWWDWRSGDGVADLLRLCGATEQRKIFQVIVAKMRMEYPFGGWPSLWEGYLETGSQFPNVITSEEREAIEGLRSEAKRKQNEFNSRNNSAPNFLAVESNKLSNNEIEIVISKLISECNVYSSSSIDRILKAIAENDNLPFEARQQFLVGLRSACPYPKRLTFMFAVCEATELSLTKSTEILAECFSLWGSSSSHLASNAKSLVERLFEQKSAELFDDEFPNISRDIRQLSDLCSDKRFVLQLVLRKLAVDEVELDGNEWLQLATSLCDVTSNKVGLNALERFLSGPAARIGDDIGEGQFRPDQATAVNEAELISDVIWHLLGDDDGYVRWTVARGVSTLFELGLNDELGLLLDRYDQREIAALASAKRELSFLNSQQWLLMGLARAALKYGTAMSAIKPKLDALAERNDLHVISKLHIARCLRSIPLEGEYNAEVKSMFEEIAYPPLGVVTCDVYPSAAMSKSGFLFDYEFTKHDVSSVAMLFNVPNATVEDAMVIEIKRLWPEATSMEYFSGHDRYFWDREDRYEYFREHVQRHALLSAATSLSRSLPIVRRGYESEVGSPWRNWLDQYDVTFDDGSWLSDRKDAVPEPAKENLLSAGVGQRETLQDQEILLRKLGYLETSSDALFPLYGSWTSPDGVLVRITSALSERNGTLSRCKAFAKRSSHDFWMPEFWDDGHYDHRNRKENPFAPLVWAPAINSLGIDVGDQIAAKGPAGRPRLGVALTKSLKLVNEPNGGDWFTKEGLLAIRSQVWGSWAPNPDGKRDHHHNDGEILWASRDWLTTSMSELNRQLVFTVTLTKYKTSRDYDFSSEIKFSLIGVRADNGLLRFWRAKKASMQ